MSNFGNFCFQIYIVIIYIYLFFVVDVYIYLFCKEIKMNEEIYSNLSFLQNKFDPLL
jgi:hypothetical protein